MLVLSVHVASGGRCKQDVNDHFSSTENHTLVLLECAGEPSLTRRERAENDTLVKLSAGAPPPTTLSSLYHIKIGESEHDPKIPAASGIRSRGLLYYYVINNAIFRSSLHGPRCLTGHTYSAEAH